MYLARWSWRVAAGDAASGTTSAKERFKDEPIQLIRHGIKRLPSTRGSSRDQNGSRVHIDVYVD